MSCKGTKWACLGKAGVLCWEPGLWGVECRMEALSLSLRPCLGSGNDGAKLHKMHLNPMTEDQREKHPPKHNVINLKSGEAFHLVLK